MLASWGSFRGILEAAWGRLGPSSGRADWILSSLELSAARSEPLRTALRRPRRPPGAARHGRAPTPSASERPGGGEFAATARLNRERGGRHCSIEK